MPYTATFDTNGTEDEFTIRAPDGRPMATIQFLDTEEAGDSQTHENANLIVDALNAYEASSETFDALTLCHEHLSLWVADVEACDLSPEDGEALAKAQSVIDKASGMAGRP